MTANVLVLVSPNAGNENRIEELIRWVTEEVKTNEPDVEIYNTYSTDGSQGSARDFIVYFRCACRILYSPLTIRSPIH